MKNSKNEGQIIRIVTFSTLLISALFAYMYHGICVNNKSYDLQLLLDNMIINGRYEDAAAALTTNLHPLTFGIPLG